MYRADKFTERVPHKAKERAKATVRNYEAIRFDDAGNVLPLTSESLARMIGLVKNIEKPMYEPGNETRHLLDQLKGLQKAFQDANDHMVSNSGEFPSKKRVSIPHKEGKNANEPHDEDMVTFFGDTSEDGTMNWIVKQVSGLARLLSQNGGRNEKSISQALLNAVEDFTDGIKFLSENPPPIEHTTVTVPTYRWDPG